MQPPDTQHRVMRLYLDLLKSCLLNEPYLENELRIMYLRTCLAGTATFDETVLRDIRRHLADRHAALAEATRAGMPLDLDVRNVGYAHSMIGHPRLDNIEHCIASILADRVPGDLIECGVWRGGAAVFMRGVLAAFGVRDRVVWLADSFAGLPPPRLPPDANLDLSRVAELAIDVDTVKHVFAAYGLLDEQVRFLKGWFRETLPGAQIES